MSKHFMHASRALPVFAGADLLVHCAPSPGSYLYLYAVEPEAAVPGVTQECDSLHRRLPEVRL